MTTLDKVLDEIREERVYQDGKWGTDFDDHNTLNDWVTYIAMYCGRAANIGATPNLQRESMRKVATLAVAACECFDRNSGFAPRHYEDKVPTD